MIDVKPTTYRSTAYLAFIRKQGCHVCGRPSEAHHTETGGVGMKASDLSAIPLCRAHHMELHSKGKKSWAAFHGLTYSEVRERYLRRFIQERL